MALILYCTKCQNEWEAEQKEMCPNCEQYRIIAAGKRWRYKIQREEFRMRMRGEAVNDRELVCELEDGGCGKPLRGYCSYEVDDETGQQNLVCECGHETPIRDRE